MSNILNEASGDGWYIANGDCIELLKSLRVDSIHHSVFSPPYLGLYAYSASERDLSNCQSDEEFWAHFGFVIDELARVMMPGRVVAVDCMQVPAMKERDGYIGLKDFRGDLIREFQKRGFIYASEHSMLKNPLIEATRTHAIGLAHQQLVKDSSMLRAGLAQYLLGFRKPGENPEPIAHGEGLQEFYGTDAPTETGLKGQHERWRRYASPHWNDIDFTDTLNVRQAREDADQKHMCPIALDIVRRSLHLWSNPGDKILSPFTGIGSEGFVSLEMGRKFIGAELKTSYFNVAVKNLRSAEPNAKGKQTSLFDLSPTNDSLSTPNAEAAE